LKREYPHFKPPPHGTLRAWADSGVLLLNTSLTVKKGCAGSHSNKGWEQFTDAVVDAIDLYGGLGLLDIPHSGEGEEQALDEPASKRVKVDHPASEDAPPCEPRPPQADQDSQKSTGSISDTNAAPSVADPKLGSSSVPELKKQPPDDKPTSADPHPSPSTNTKQCDDSQSVPSPAETNPQAEPLEAAGTEAQATSKMPAGEIKAYAAPGFGKGVVFLCWGKWAADRVARLSDVSIAWLQFLFRDCQVHLLISCFSPLMCLAPRLNKQVQTSHPQVRPSVPSLRPSWLPGKQPLQARQRVAREQVRRGSQSRLV
jgi:hypothetical protein